MIDPEFFHRKSRISDASFLKARPWTRQKLEKMQFLKINEKGSIIVLAIMILALVTIIGVVAIKMAATESFNVRNITIYKQNLQLVEGAAMEGLQRIVDMEYDAAISDLDPRQSKQIWIQDDENWENTMDSLWLDPKNLNPVLDATNSVVPEAVLNGNRKNNRILAERGELYTDNLSNVPLRYVMVGWDAAPGYSLSATEPVRRAGRLLAEYASTKYGLLRVEIGVERKF